MMETMPALTDHQRAIIAVVLEHPDIRRSELAAKLGISAQTTMRAVLPLIKIGALQETLLNTGGRGKPASSLKFVSFSILTLGISLASDRIRVEFSDLAGQVMVSLSTEKSYQNAADQLSELDELLAAGQLQIPAAAMLVGAGVSIQGYFLDRGTRFMARADPNGWPKIDLQAHLFERLGVPVKLMNDGITLASSLILIAPYKNFVCLHLGSGIGGGIVSGGRMLVGANGNAGELGNLFPASPDRPVESAFLKASQIEKWTDWPGILGLPAPAQKTLLALLKRAGAMIATAMEQSLAVLDFEAAYVCSRMPADLLKALCDNAKIMPVGTNLVGQNSDLRNPAPILHPYHVPLYAPLACRMARDIFLTTAKTTTA